MSQPYFPGQDDLFRFWKHIEDSRAFWETFPQMAVCSATADGASIMFPSCELTTVSTPEALLRLSQTSRGDRIAVLSPWIWLDSTHLLNFLRMSTRRELNVLGLNFLSDMDVDVISTRKLIHSAGYYEVVEIEGVDGLSWQAIDSSVAYTPDGTFSYHSSLPGISVHQEGYIALGASRAAFGNAGSRHWNSVIGLPRRSQGATSQQPEGPNSFSLTTTEISSPYSSEHILSGNFSWSASAASGHASLVTCYSGPGDENMYAALIEPGGEGRASVSLWRHWRNWEKLEGLQIKAPIVNDRCSISLSVKTSTEAIEVLVNGVSSLYRLDDRLGRTGVVGLRLMGDSIKVSDIKVG